MKHLNFDKKEDAYCTRMIRYLYDLENSTVPPELLELADRDEARYQVPENIWGIAGEKGKIW